MDEFGAAPIGGRWEGAQTRGWDRLPRTAGCPISQPENLLLVLRIRGPELRAHPGVPEQRWGAGVPGQDCGSDRGLSAGVSWGEAVSELSQQHAEARNYAPWEPPRPTMAPHTPDTQEK